ncbi:MAG: dihydrofolate reductase [Allobaculum sp.]
MKLFMIAAIGKNRELGLNGDMPWQRALKEDLRFFRKTTAGHTMVMGRKTFESLPGLLPGRKHIVITRSGMEEQENLEVFPSIEAFKDAYKDCDETIFVIGGGSVYKQFADECDGMYLTLIDDEFEADTWFPEWNDEEFEAEELDVIEENGYSYRHVLFTRKDRD